MLNFERIKRKFPIQSIYQKSKKHIYECEHGYLAYENGPLSLVVAGDPIVDKPEDFKKIMSEFLGYAHGRRKSVCGYYFSDQFKNSTDFRFLQAGTSGFLNLKDFKLGGKEREPVRRALNYGVRNNYGFKEISHRKKPHYYEKVKQLEEKWLKSKKRPKVKFLLSPVNLKYENSELEKWFIVTNEFGHLGAFVSVFPYGDNEYYIDQMIHNPDSSRMSLDFLISKLIILLKRASGERMSFGFNAFKVQSPDNMYERTLEFFFKHPWAYNAPGVYAFKSKYFEYEVPRYIMLEEDSAAWKQILSMGAVTFMSH